MKIQRIALLALFAAATGASAADLLGKKAGQQDFLPVDEAFEIQPLEVRGDKLVVGWRIADNYYLYRHRLKFNLKEPAGAELGRVEMADGEKHVDAHFGETEIYRGLFEVSFPKPEGAGPFAVEVGYQGCADAGLCYPPQKRTLDTR